MVPAPPATAFSDAWKRHAHAAGSLAWRLRFELAEQGRTREALELIARLVRRPRSARAVLAHPVSVRLPWVLMRHRQGADDAALREEILTLRSWMPGCGRCHAELALHLLGDSGAIERAAAVRERCRAG